MPGSICWHGIAGLLLGFGCTGIAFLLWSGLPNSLPALAAIAAGWIYVAAEVWLTRGLHWDGVADMGDALGSGARGEKFWLVLKDSRLGAFGAMTLLLLLATQASAVALHWDNFAARGWTALFPLILAPFWARLTSIWLGFGCSGHDSSALGAMICRHVTGGRWFLAWVQAAIILSICLAAGFSIAMLLALAAAQICLNVYFRRLGQLHGGLSGDFFGCLIEVSQTCFLLLTGCGIQAD